MGQLSFSRISSNMSEGTGGALGSTQKEKVIYFNWGRVLKYSKQDKEDGGGEI